MQDQIESTVYNDCADLHGQVDFSRHYGLDELKLFLGNANNVELADSSDHLDKDDSQFYMKVTSTG